ncbi:MAG: bifunctional UDP-N-acetylglucosamine diphosphorylase/glucosamine-1-phosphate N-acetyltransferase GlmU [Candidatus Puniceispirillum sp.]
MDIVAIILAAGQGTRMKSALPKPLHAVGGMPMLGWSLNAAQAVGAKRIVTVLPRNSETTQNWLGDIEFAIQTEARGTGHAVLATKEKLADFSGIALVMFGDTPLITAATLNQLTHRIKDGADIAVLGFHTADPTGYGRLICDKEGQLSAIIEQKDANEAERQINFVNGGIMAVACPLIFDLLDAVSDDNASGEIYLTDIVHIANERGHSVATCETDEAEITGVNNRADLARVEGIIQSRLRTAALDQGVTMHAPETVFLSADAVIERDVIIEPHVVIGADTHIGEGSIIKSFSHIEGARLGPCCIIGPYARLRPGTVAGDGVKIGNFVETKNTNLAAGAKANHLTYLGDATIGEHANIGAGTITCNYDGTNKFKTLIGDGAFIGSNSALVAPVSIGANAIVGAGSTVTSDVPDDAIAIARGKQTNIDDAATSFRERAQAKKQKP